MEVVGGASIWAQVSMTTSWPGARLVCDEAGLAVFVRLLPRALVGPQPSFSATWDRLAPVDRAGRTVILQSTGPGRDACRFGTPNRKKLEAVLKQVEQRGAPIRQVRSTFRSWYIGRSARDADMQKDRPRDEHER